MGHATRDFPHVQFSKQERLVVYQQEKLHVRIETCEHQDVDETRVHLTRPRGLDGENYC